MELITHYLIGVLIQILCFLYFLFPFNIFFTVYFAFLSHFVIDALAKLTYHTPEARYQDKFWVTWHIIIFVSSLGVVVIFLIPFWLGGVLANFVDIWDWLILRPTQNKKKKENPQSIWGKKYYFHPIADWLRNKTLFWAPNCGYKRVGIITEICIIFALLYFIIPLI